MSDFRVPNNEYLRLEKCMNQQRVRLTAENADLIASNKAFKLSAGLALQERDNLKAENAALLTGIRRAIDELMDDDGDFVQAVGDLCTLVGWTYPVANDKPTPITVAELIRKAKEAGE